MLFLKKSLLLIVLSALTVVSASASYRLVLQSGHDGPPVSMEWHSLSSSVISVGEDGRLIVTRPRDNRVLHRFRVTDDRIHDMKSDPSGNRAAIVTTDGEGYTLSVWDWTEEEMDFDYELESEPLFLSWSARGRYLIIGNLGSPSVVILEGKTGRRLSYLQRLPSLYNAAYIGSTENILMTYASSGELRYWDIRSSALKLSETTTGGLESISVLQSGSKSSMIGHRLESVYLINRLTGEVLDQVDIPGLSDISVDEEQGELDVLSYGIAGSAIYRFDVVDDRFVPRDGNLSPRRVDSGLKPTKILRRSGTTYFTTESGTLFSDGGLDFTPIIDDNIWRPDDLAFQGNSLYLAGGRTIRKFTSEFFAEDSKGSVKSLNELTQEEEDSESGAQDVGLEAMSNGDIVVWDKSDGGNANGIHRLSFGRASRTMQIPMGGPLQKVSVIDGQRLLAVDRSGTVSVVDSTDGEILSTYSALGILDAAYSPEGDYLLTGRSSAGRSGTPLEVVDIRTREAIPIDDDRFMIYQVVRG
ncbi:MAG: WD40 repeat domain-containing protein, partial [Spirochaetaceae bacterium]|nr:WD40 repeat domain-containing protein [Spirochaetaceae bacterium]